MKLSFRWYGENDTIPLQYIKQIPGVGHIVSAVYDVDVGRVWSRESIRKIQSECQKNSLSFSVVESIPVHEDIKLGAEHRDEFIENYCENIRRVSEVGVDCVTYNFMPIFDWTRTQTEHLHSDGSQSLVMYKDELSGLDPLKDDISLPGWDTSYHKDEIRRLIKAYAGIGEAGLWENLEYFLGKVMPVAEACGVKMALHPDDPPYSIFGIPRIVTCEENLDRILKMCPSKSHCLCICTGSLGCVRSNDIVRMIKKYAEQKRIAFMHIRNVKILNEGSFEEVAHPSECGSLDMYEIVNALVEAGYDGYVRPDHGRMIWGESGKPGYGLYDRALGASYIKGLWEACEKSTSGGRS
ncbi:MAG: mannonate dehydratase [Ruminococcaceae bacterium]|nr:mannonate dehydratase [Oscillospiraceae bacterium]